MASPMIAATAQAAAPVADAELLRQVFARLAVGVTVVTTVSPGGPKGMTATAVCSVSLEPLLVLACLHNASRTLAAIEEADVFAVNVLREDQAGVADAFASPMPDQARFAAAPYRMHRGVPVLTGALAWVTCGVAETYPGGDHTIVLGAVTETSLSHGEPLVRQSGRYRRLAPARSLRSVPTAE